MGDLMPNLGMIVAGIGVIVAAITMPTIWKGWTSRRWSETTGVLLAAKIRMSQEEDSDWSDGSYTPGRPTHRYHAWVRYEYKVNGTSYKSERIGYGITYSNSNEMWVRIWLLERKWEAGNQIVVYYNPQSPGESVLIPGLSGGHLIQLTVGIALTLAGAAIRVALSQ